MSADKNQIQSAGDSIAFPIDVLRFGTEHDIDLLWSKRDNRLIPAAICSDCFAWGGADAEEITPATFDLFKATVEECEKLDEAHESGQKLAVSFADELFAARVRRMRPQGASYELYPPVLWPLFDACGPKRETGIGNPRPQPEVQTEEMRKKWAERAPSYEQVRAERDTAKLELECVYDFYETGQPAIDQFHAQAKQLLAERSASRG